VIFEDFEGYTCNLEDTNIIQDKELEKSQINKLQVQVWKYSSYYFLKKKLKYIKVICLFFKFYF
jgi:hypothetical protein